MRSDEAITCPKCRQTYHSGTNFCPADGTRLNSEVAVKEPHSFEKTLNVADIQTAREKHSLVGQVLDGQYEILSMVGKGGMSIVYKARHIMLRKIVAVKTLLPHLVLHPHSLQRFQQEAQAASNIVHTNVVTIHNFGVTPEGQPYLVMDYLEGISLHQLIEDTGHLPIERAVNIFIQVANALDRAHEKGVIHRDLKPSNIILIEQGEKHDIAQLVDFGIAKLLPREGSEAINLTQTGEVFGSPLYMSPEQCRGEKLDARSDIYSMGCLMYECLAGRPPHSGDNTLEVLYKHINVVPSPIGAEERKAVSPIAFLTGSDLPSASPPVTEVKVPSALEAIVFKALAKTPEGRYQSMAELERDLEAFQKSQQFSLLSIAKSRWELFRLKRGPRSKSEKITSVVWVSVSLVGMLGCSLPAINFWNLADSPAAKQKIIWEDEKRKIQKKSSTSDLFAASVILKDADEFLHSNKGDPQEIYDSITHAGKRLEEFGLWDEASKMFAKAVEISNVSNGESSYPTILLKQELADTYYNQGRLKDAEREYQDLQEKLNTDRRMLQYTLVLSNLGNCYFDEERYAAAEKCYKAAILAWRSKAVEAKDSRAVEGQAKEFGLLSVSRLSLAALTFSRLAEIVQMKAENKLQLSKASDLGAETFYKVAAECNFQALPMWRQTEGPDGKNTGICQLHLAEDLAHLKEIQLVRKAPIEDTVQDQSHDMNVESLFESTEEIFKSAYGSAHPYLAIALLRHADYELDKKNNWKKFLQLRFKACSILSSAKNDLK
jgi:serine/threonine protein kinase